MGSLPTNLVSGIVLAALSGLTFLAYKHPRGYERIWMVITICWSYVFIAIVVWNLALTVAAMEVQPFVDKSKFAKTKEALHDIGMHNNYLFLGGVAATAYLGFLAFLPKILGKEHKPDGER